MRDLTEKSFLLQLWALVRLRYRLIWANARTGNGRVTLLFALYLLGGLAGLFFSLGGLGAAVLGIETGQGEPIARLVLTGLFINGIGLSLLFGLGPRAAYAEESLRRYPLSSNERFVIRHAIGLLDPAWLILMAGVAGLVIGFVWLGAGSAIAALPAIFLFIAANYLTTVLLLSIIGRVMQSRSGAAMLGGMVILLISLGPLVIGSVVKVGGENLARWFDSALRFSPSGAAASMITADDSLDLFGGAGLLVLWIAGLVLMLGRIERRPLVAQSVSGGSIVWNDSYDQMSNLFGGKYGPLMAKSLRYNLRCNLILFSLITSPLIILMGKFLIPNEVTSNVFFISLAMFFIMSSATGAALMLNLFAFDGAGIRRYAVLPISLADAMRAGSLASLLLRALVVLAAFALWLLFYNREAITWQMIFMLSCVALASLFMFNAFGLWTSIYSPKIGDFNSMWNNRLSVGANVVVIGGALIPFLLLMRMSGRIGPDLLNRYWWTSALFLFACLAFYAFSLWAIEKPIRMRREAIINLIAGAQDK